MPELLSSAEKTREFYRRQGEKREQERIIKLIEEDCACIMPRSEYYFGCRSHLLIALIKGENK